MSASSRFTLLPAAVTGLAVVAGAEAKASVIYSGPLNETFTASDSLSLDLNGDGNSDVSMTVVTDYYTKPSFSALNGAMLTSTNANSGSSVESAPPDTYSTDGFYEPSTEYFGVQIPAVSGTTPLYGWVEYSYDGSSTGTLLGYAYDNSGADIEMGQTSAVPEPSSTGMAAGVMALLAGSAVLWRRRKAMTARVA